MSAGISNDEYRMSNAEVEEKATNGVDFDIQHSVFNIRHCRFVR